MEILRSTGKTTAEMPSSLLEGRLVFGVVFWFLECLVCCCCFWGVGFFEVFFFVFWFGAVYSLLFFFGGVSCLFSFAGFRVLGVLGFLEGGVVFSSMSFVFGSIKVLYVSLMLFKVSMCFCVFVVAMFGECVFLND